MIAILNTVNHLYTDTRYNNKICYNDNLNGMKPSLKIRNYTREFYLILQDIYVLDILENIKIICFGYLLELPPWGNSNKYPNHIFYEEISINHCLSYISFC